MSFHLFFSNSAEYQEYTLLQLKRLRSSKRFSGMTGMVHGPGSPTADEEYLMERFTVHMSVPETPADLALSHAVHDLNERIDQRVGEATQRSGTVKIDLGNLSEEDKAIKTLMALGYTMMRVDQNNIEGIVLFKGKKDQSDVTLLKEATDYFEKSALGKG